MPTVTSDDEAFPFERAYRSERLHPLGTRQAMTMAIHRPVIVVQARFSSARLPGKVLRPMAGQPMLAWMLDSLQRCRSVAGLVVATSAEPSDHAVAAWAEERGVAVHRGPLNDVATRLLDAAKAAGATALVRVSGDSPLMDWRLVDQMVALFQAVNCDLATNIQIRTFPKGLSVEVIATAALERALAMMDCASDREHVTPVFYRRPEAFRIVNLTSGGDFGGIQMSVDTAEDFTLAERVIQHLGHPADHDLQTMLECRAAILEKSE